MGSGMFLFLFAFLFLFLWWYFFVAAAGSGSDSGADADSGVRVVGADFAADDVANTTRVARKLTGTQCCGCGRCFDFDCASYAAVGAAAGVVFGW